MWAESGFLLHNFAWTLNEKWWRHFLSLEIVWDSNPWLLDPYKGDEIYIFKIIFISAYPSIWYGLLRSASYFCFRIPLISEMDCGDRVCEVEYHLLPNCLLYTDISEDKHCAFPCSTSNCATELHHFMLCPVWSCTSKSTTTPSTPLSTLTPWPKSSSYCSASVCVPSLVFNGLFGIMIVAAVALFLIYRRRNQRLMAFYHSSTNPLFEAEAGFDYFQNQRPIIRNSTSRSSRTSERDPLISQRRASNPRPEVESQPPLPLPAILSLSQTSSIQETQFWFIDGRICFFIHLFNVMNGMRYCTQWN